MGTRWAPVDLGNCNQARQWVTDAAAAYGRVDILSNNAAAPRLAPVPELTEQDWHSAPSATSSISSSS